MRLYTEFYNSDIILASPLGLSLLMTEVDADDAPPIGTCQLTLLAHFDGHDPLTNLSISPALRCQA